MSATAKVKPGPMLAHYQVLDRVGEGAMGTVYLAHDTGLDRPVAVKVLRSEVTDDASTLARFNSEARAAARVNHPNLTHIYFVGAEDDWHFFAMELVLGADLEALVAARGTFDLASAIDILVQAARGLGAAHRAGVVHRDVKPSNIILRPDGVAKITDFGLSKALDAEVSATHAGQVLGTPMYMSPEQCRGDPTDIRTDVYSLGLTAWFLFTGKPAFPGPSLGKVINDQMNTPLPRLTQQRPDLSEHLEEVLDKLCAKEPDDRPSDMDEVIELLEACRPRTIDPAPLAARAAALLLDVAIVGGVVVACMALLQMIFRVPLDNNPWTGILFAAVWTVNHLGGELWWRQSVGKWLFNLAVSAENGTRPNRRALLARFLMRYPTTPFHLLLQPFLMGPLHFLVDVGEASVLLAGAVVYYFTKGRTLSDVWTRTRVVYRMPRERPRPAAVEGEPGA